MALYENWTQEHGSPSIATDETGHTLTLKYWANWVDVWVGLPEIGSFYPGGLTKYNDTKLTNYSIANMDGGERARIVLVYKSPQKGSGSSPVERKDTASVLSMSDGALEKPLETHSDYVMKWNYSLAKKTGTTVSKPSGWNTATEDTLTSAQTAGWMWVKELTDVGDGWSIEEAATMKGTESYLVPAPIVNDRTYYTRAVKRK